MNSIRRATLAATLFLSALVPGAAFALSLDEAKSQGLVGEESTGYVGSVQTPASGEVAALVSQINNQRKTKYAEIAKKNGTTLAAVEALAGQKAVENTAAGGFVKTGGGSWKKK